MPDQEQPSAAPKPAEPVVKRDDSGKKLTAREQDVLKLMTTGATNNQIAAELSLSTKTVMHHSVSIYAKLGVRGRAEAVAWAYRHGLVAVA